MRPFDLQLFADEKTEPATPKRQEESRKRGQAARSSDLNAFAGMAAVFLLLFWQRGALFPVLESYLREALSQVGALALTQQNVGSLAVSSFYFFLELMLPVFLIAMITGIAVNFVQVGFLFSLEVLRPRFSNLDPIGGLGRLFSRKALMEMLKSILKVTLVGLVGYYLIKGRYEQLVGLTFLDVPASVAFVLDLVFRVALVLVFVFLPVAVGDYLFQRHQFQQQLRMSKQEIREEMRQSEGDPLVKSQLRKKQRQLASHRMMQQVPKATVVITNPTHLAAALYYHEGKTRAPRLVAKGAGEIARRIVEVARENGVPVVENRPVARFLFQHGDIDAEIPAELYQAVAEILAMLYRMGRLKKGLGVR